MEERKKWTDDPELIKRFLEYDIIAGLHPTETFAALEREFGLTLGSTYHDPRYAHSIAWGVRAKAETRHPILFGYAYYHPNKVKKRKEVKRPLIIPHDIKQFVKWLPGWIDSCDDVVLEEVDRRS